MGTRTRKFALGDLIRATNPEFFHFKYYGVAGFILALCPNSDYFNVLFIGSNKALIFKVNELSPYK